MKTIPCSVEGCSEVFTTNEAVSSSAKFLCRNHTEKVEIKTSLHWAVSAPREESPRGPSVEDDYSEESFA